jgi:hypothetical protein
MRPFEQRMLNEMANSVLCRRLVARASPHPNSKTDRPKPRHVFRQNCETICEAGVLNLIYHHVYAG